MMNALSGAVARRAAPVLGFLHRAEELLAAGALAAMALLPLAEIVVRPIVAGGIPGSIPFVQHLTLWVGFLGAGLAARQNKLIALATATFIPEGTARQVAQGFAATVGATVSALLAWSAIDVVVIEMEVGGEIRARDSVVGLPVGAAVRLRRHRGAAGVAGRRLGRACGCRARHPRRHLAERDGSGLRAGRGRVVRAGRRPRLAMGRARGALGPGRCADLHGAGGGGGLPVYGRRVRPGDGAAVRLRPGHRAASALHPALHADRVHPGPGAVVGAVAARVPRARRLDAGRDGGGLRRRLRVLHDLHGRFRP